MSDSITVVIVDDHYVTRRGIVSLLDHNPKVQIVGEGSAGEHVLDLLSEHNPDVLIVDLQMPMYEDQPNGPWFEPARTLQQALSQNPDTAIVVLSQEQQTQTIQTLAEIGVQGYLLKADTSTHFLDKVIEIIHTGNHYFSPEIQRIIYAADPLARDEGFSLTERQLDTLRGIARYPEASRKELADKLNITTSTLQKHINAIFTELQTTNMVSTVLQAMRLGLISFEEPAEQSGSQNTV